MSALIPSGSNWILTITLPISQTTNNLACAAINADKKVNVSIGDRTTSNFKLGLYNFGSSTQTNRSSYSWISAGY